jgi:hypothetical protein
MNFRLGLWATAIAVMLAAGCDIRQRQAGKLVTQSETIQPGEAKTARADIVMGVGELSVEGGAKELMQAEFRYNVEEWKPEVKYAVASQRGVLSVRQPSIPWKKAWYSNARYEWDVKLSNHVPLDAHVVLGTGKSKLKLGGMNLTSLRVEGGVGECQLDLSGNWSRDLDVEIRGGIGQVAVKLPRNVAVRVKTSGGLGAVHTHDLKADGDYYVNDAFGKPGPVLRVDIAGGIGEIDLGPAD